MVEEFTVFSTFWVISAVSPRLSCCALGSCSIPFPSIVSTSRQSKSCSSLEQKMKPYSERRRPNPRSRKRMKQILGSKNWHIDLLIWTLRVAVYYTFKIRSQTGLDVSLVRGLSFRSSTKLARRSWRVR